MRISLIINEVVETLGPGKRLCIWTNGCHKRCPKCETPEFQKIMPSLDVDIVKILEEMDLSNDDGVTISGGEPFIQLNELRSLVNYLSIKFDDIIVYSGLSYETLKMIDGTDEIFSKISALIDGEYIRELDEGKKLVGSSNQNIIVFKEKYREQLLRMNDEERKMSIYKLDGHYYGVGLKERGKE